ncbi:MAG: outer membrane beta-barrel protein [Prevotella sp.]|nr:outer membrane beta-barrel protein [Prevotella sp.]
MLWYIQQRIKLLLLAVACLPLAADAQDDDEYRMEVGAGAGLVTYVGDFNGNLLKEMQPWGVLTARYHLNPRMALALAIGTGKIKGSTDGADTWYPIERYEFSHQLTEATLRYEYNFWAYGTGHDYRGARRVVPFVALGLGMVHHSGENSGVTLSLPLGAGIKWKVAPRLNLTAEWAMRFTPSDYLDGRSDVYGIKSSGLFKNTDCYSAFQFSVTYDLWVRCKTCNNDRD